MKSMHTYTRHSFGWLYELCVEWHTTSIVCLWCGFFSFSLAHRFYFLFFAQASAGRCVQRGLYGFCFSRGFECGLNGWIKTTSRRHQSNRKQCKSPHVMLLLCAVSLFTHSISIIHTIGAIVFDQAIQLHNFYIRKLALDVQERFECFCIFKKCFCFSLFRSALLYSVVFSSFTFSCKTANAMAQICICKLYTDLFRLPIRSHEDGTGSAHLLTHDHLVVWAMKTLPA